ncbi:ABC-F family ATP-binding cassette domain-containing protein [Acinetobacter qingfengensis]|uniref:ABC transporter ATP-binding protein n=1 Tax=Acinetobacter qingfengensis TaxID=1262585 RepID=A0A1E7R8Y6_9GAMM|nr:ATP-binding cassette domain-containing protein [Acinetobacter qingfengensis]KAA8735403.1 ABC-F family ATP-binding cassette domain-containing protein [Acinetobacter qingfengensis]OEY95761.1 ABC transporter ATP-binding protein [Acinetobacter qingfengensis]
MPQACIISNLSLSFSTQNMFDQLNFTLYSRKTSALIGRNGLGKSLLFQILHLQHHLDMSYSGQIAWHVQHDHLSQLQRLNAKTIAQALEVEHLYTAFQCIENNTASFEDYDLVENAWDLPQKWQKILQNAQLPTDLNYPTQQLSEGQKTKLALCKLFLKKNHYLLLDEPSNHLDVQSRQWLMESILTHTAGVCLISHDRQLLDQVQHIYALTELGLQHIRGNYTDYIQQYQQQINALTQSIQQEKRELKQLKQQQHESLMKAQKRQRKGIQLRDSNSQAKILLDFKKEQAGQSFGKLRTQHLRQIDESQSRLQDKQTTLEKIKPQKFEFQLHSTRQGEILRINDLTLPYASTQKINFSMRAGEKIQLKGINGIGKSTLLKMIAHHQTQEIIFNGICLYLDQNFSLLKNNLTVIENLTRFNHQIPEVEWRKLLGQLRIHREKAQLKLTQLSGGEKLKVALLAISHVVNGVDLLLLDEPENHLDIESKTLLAQAIQQFQGTIILVSHDKFFIEECGINEEYLLS